MKMLLVLAFCLTSKVFAFDYGFDGCSARFKRIARAQLAGHREVKRVNWLTPNVVRFVEQDGGNIGNSISFLSNVTSENEIDRAGFAIAWIYRGNNIAVCFNHAARPSDAEIIRCLKILVGVINARD